MVVKSQDSSTAQDSVGPSKPIEDESPVEEVAPVKRKITIRRQLAKKTMNELDEPWSSEEEIALCKAWINVYEHIIEGNAKKAQGFWTKVLTYFENEMKESKKRNDLVLCKWKNSLRPKVTQFRAVYDTVKGRHQSGASETIIYDQVVKEYRVIYRSPFTLTECWRILKDHRKWKMVKIQRFDQQTK